MWMMLNKLVMMLTQTISGHCNTPFSACTSLIAGSLSALSQAASLVAACCIASSHIVATHLVVCTVTCLVQQVFSLVARPTALVDTLYLTNVGIGAGLLGTVIVLGCGLGRMLQTKKYVASGPSGVQLVCSTQSQCRCTRTK